MDIQSLLFVPSANALMSKDAVKLQGNETAQRFIENVYHFFKIICRMKTLVEMGRSATGKKRVKPDAEALEAAANEILAHSRPLREIANLYGVSKSTLGRHIQKHKVSMKATFKYEANNSTRKVFSTEQENELLTYIIKAAQWNYGVTVEEMRKLAYQYAKLNNVNYPESWDNNKTAGRQWYRCFRTSYNNKISLRKPEATSLGRMACFNKPNVLIFFDKLGEIYSRLKLTPQNVWNLDETGCPTVHKPVRVLGDIKAKQIGAATSGERGINVTMIACVSAAGTFIPPGIIFPRVHFKEHMINNAPPGTIGMATSSGWSNAELFVEYLQHFISVVKPSPENKVLLILDNHESHLSLAAIHIARDNGIVILTFPPHTSHKLQPLDRSVFGPFKNYFNNASKEWMLYHPGKPISIYDMSELIGKAFPLAFTPNNISSGFKVAGHLMQTCSETMSSYQLR
ncbi:uncharacterized protein [Diabrotica undecimpunctata]|uniref:uncharacterized protein n=1 Tax=Diabrotica undecimpunctata TaxID=50387 RepID=UPI003B63AF74